MDELLKKLNLQQMAAVTFGSGPVLIVAGAGTGKTTVVTNRVANLILSEQAKVDEVLALTFTEKAAQEMEERIDRIMPYGYLDLWVSTFHSFAEKILKSHALEIGLTDEFKLLDTTAQWLLIRQNFSRFNLDYYRPLGNPSKFIHALLKHFSRAKDEEIYPEEYLEYAQNQKLNTDGLDEINKLEIQRLEEVANAYHTYQQLLHEKKFLDFGDLINYTLKLFRQRPHLLTRYREQFKFILVDEFQDTNWAQYQLIKMLAAPKNNLTVVADDDQSIYKFRGASVGNILAFKNDFPTAKEIVLTKNYRSRQNLLDNAYKFIQLNNPNRLECRLDGLSKKLTALAVEPGILEHNHFETDEDEAEGVIKKILFLKEADSDATYSDFAILVRANSQADIFVQALIRAGVPYQFLASDGLYNRPVIIDAISYLRLLDNHHDSPAWYRVLNLPFFNFPAADLSELLHYCKRKTLSLYLGLQQASLVPVSAAGQKIIGSLLKRLDQDRYQARTQKASQLIFNFLQGLEINGQNYLKFLGAEDSQLNHEALDQLNQFFRQVKNFEKDSGNQSVAAFLDFINLAQEAGDAGGLNQDPNVGPETVKVLTVHSAKGLEFKYVFVVNLVDRRFPSLEKSEAIELPQPLIKEAVPEGDVHLEEERRLFYVAMTRAKQGLFLTSADDYGGTRKRKLSRFLSELGFTAESVSRSGIKAGLPVITNQEPSKFKFDFKLPAKFSFTQIRAFETCPWQYRFSHILQIPVPGHGRLSFGKTLHLTLQKFFQRLKDSQQNHQTSMFAGNPSSPKVPSLEDLLKLYDESWIDEWYESQLLRDEYRENGRQVLKEFYQKHDGKFPIPKYIEQPFNLKVGDYCLKGQIDRVDILADGTAEIIDYKSGRPPQDSKIDKDKKEQLLIYQIAAEEVFGEKVSRLTYYYLESNTPVTFLGKPEDLVELKGKILETLTTIKAGKFPPKPNKFICQSCDFRNICEYKA